MALTTPALEARSLYRFFRAGDEEVLALRGVSMVARAGELVAVGGPSGSGKSTLMSCLAGLDEPSGGAALVHGRRMSHQPEPVRARLRARHVGILMQSGNLVEQLTVAQNVELVRRLARDGRDSRVPVDHLLAGLGLAGRGDAHPSELSGGQAARAGLAVALANDPDVLLADEPSGELDGQTENELLDLLVDRARSGGAVVVASHSSAVLAVADRVVGLRDGVVVA
jgi:putative ABC transport system ATP-binding protein